MSANPTSTQASQAAEAAIQVLVKETSGAILIGLLFSAVFFGVTLLQTYQYYEHYWHDKLFTKCFVAVVTILDLFQLVTVFDSAWWFLIENYGNINSVALVPRALGIEVAATATIGLLVQCFFAQRVYALSQGNRWITLLIAVLALTQWIFAIYYVGKGQATELASTIKIITWASTTALGLGVGTDVLIASALVYYLYNARSGIMTADKLIDTLIMYTVNTGCLSTICAIMTIALSESYPSTYWDVMFYFMLSKCYVNSTLATLNAREKLRQDAQPAWKHAETTLPLSVMSATATTPSPSASPMHDRQPQHKPSYSEVSSLPGCTVVTDKKSGEYSDSFPTYVPRDADAQV